MTEPDAKWAKRSLWTLLEAAQICADREPQDYSVVRDNPHAVFRGMGDDPARCVAEELYARSKDAVQVGQLKSFGSRTGHYGNIRVRPYDYIQWAKAAGFPVATVAVGVPSSQPTRLALRQQEAAILEWLRNLEYDPTSLPRSPKGRPGPKSEVRKKLKDTALFLKGPRVFDKAWQRLRDFGDIKDAE